MKLEDLKANPELASKLEDEYLESLLAQGIEKCNEEQLAISNGLHAIHTLAYTNTQINWALTQINKSYLESNSLRNLTNSLNILYKIKQQCLQKLEKSLPYLLNYLESL